MSDVLKHIMMVVAKRYKGKAETIQSYAGLLSQFIIAHFLAL